MLVVYNSLLTPDLKCSLHWYYLEDVGLLAGELCQLEAVLPLRLPGDHTPVQHQGVPQHGVAATLLLEQQQGRLPTASLPGEPWACVLVTRHVMKARGQGETRGRSWHPPWAPCPIPASPAPSTRRKKWHYVQRTQLFSYSLQILYFDLWNEKKLPKLQILVQSFSGFTPLNINIYIFR